MEVPLPRKLSSSRSLARRMRHAWLHSSRPTNNRARIPQSLPSSYVCATSPRFGVRPRVFRPSSSCNVYTASNTSSLSRVIGARRVRLLCGPGQFKNLYLQFTKPLRGNKLSIWGEAVIAHHHWISGAFDSSYNTVLASWRGTQRSATLMRRKA